MAKEIARIQKEMLNLYHKIKPEYFPVAEPVRVSGRDILIIWVPGGANRPYKAPISLAKGSTHAYYIRRFSSTKKASDSEERTLMALANNIPCDDRINHGATLKDIHFNLVSEYLTEIKSALADQAQQMPFHELCLKMNIADGPAERIKPKNIGLLFFNEHPDKFFPGARIDVVEFEDEAGDAFTEKIFTGPVHQQTRAALSYLKNSLVKEFVRKIAGKAEATRFFNYPYSAIEEALVNAVYHRSYEEHEPVEVRVYRDRIIIVSYPGPLPPLNKDNINKPQVISRRYRNRRLGDFFKELHLAEGRCTGFPKIRKALKNNGSPSPVFETDEERSYFNAIIKIHPRAKEIKIAGQVGEQVSEQVLRLLDYCRMPRTKQEILKFLGLAPVYLNYKRNIHPLLGKGFLELTIPDKPTSRLQKYRVTKKGRAFPK